MKIKICKKCGKPKIRESYDKLDFCQCDFVGSRTKEHNENKINYVTGKEK